MTVRHIHSIIQLCRPKQWVKNLFVFLPLFFSGNLLNIEAGIDSLIAAVAFCFASSAIYCLNDLMDVDADRRHPQKRFRPLAAGAVSKSACITMTAVLVMLAELVLLLLPDGNLWPSFLVLTSYIVLNIAYCLKLKSYAVIDVVIVSFGFVLRVAIGGTSAAIYVSHWIIMMTFLLALFLALSKRRDDIVIYNNTGDAMRRNVTRYNLEFISQASTLVSTIMLVCYIMYTVQPEVVARFNSDNIYITTIFVLLGILRYIQITVVDVRSGNPTRILLHDRFVQLCVLGWILTFAAIIYL